MSLPPENPRSAPRPGRSHAAVLSIGRRVFVHCPDEPTRGIALTDDAGRDLTPRLADGAAVEVVAWRPRGGAGTRYRVRATSGQVDGWLGAEALRATPEPGPSVGAPSPEPPRPLPAAAVDTARKFGQRR
jgi:hypothetical protein